MFDEFLKSYPVIEWLVFFFHRQCRPWRFFMRVWLHQHHCQSWVSGLPWKIARGHYRATTKPRIELAYYNMSLKEISNAMTFSMSLCDRMYLARMSLPLPWLLVIPPILLSLSFKPPLMRSVLLKYQNAQIYGCAV
jgi:hypothetical protein